MPTQVQAPDGSLVEFPDGVPQDTMEAAMRAQYPHPDEGAMYSADLQRYLSPEEAQQRSHNTTVGMNASMGNDQQSGFTQSLRSVLRGLTAGWGPQLTGQATSAINGEDPQLRAEVERRQDDLNAQAHPIINTLAHGLGSAGAIVGGGAALGGLPYVGPALDAVGNALGRIPAITQGGRQAAADALAAGRNSTSLGTAVATGGAVNAPLGASEEMADKGATPQNALVGGVKGFAGGATGAGLIHGGSQVVGPWATEAAQRLLNEGVPLSPGQVTGGFPQWMESMAGSIPFTGAMTRRAGAIGNEGMNRAVLNRSIQPVEDILNAQNPQITPRGSLQIGGNVRTGHDAFNHAEDVLNQTYQAVLPHTQLDISHPQLTNDVNATLADAQANLEPNVMARLDSIVQRNLFTRLASAGAANQANPGGNVVPGENIQQIQSSLRSLVRQFSGDGNADNRQMAYYLRGIVNHMDDEVARQNPGVAPLLQAANHGYAALTIARNASTRAGNREGVFTPSALQAAIRNADRSVDHVSSARGTAMLQDLGDAAKSTIRDFPNSGTPERTAFMHMLGGLEGGGYGAGYALAGPGALAPLAIGPALYNPASKAAFRTLAAGAPETRNALMGGIQQYSPRYAAATLAPSLGNKERNSLNYWTGGPR